MRQCLDDEVHVRWLPSFPRNMYACMTAPHGRSKDLPISLVAIISARKRQPSSSSAVKSGPERFPGALSELFRASRNEDPSRLERCPSAVAVDVVALDVWFASVCDDARCVRRLAALTAGELIRGK